MNLDPLITIVTVSYNAKSDVEKTIKSVLSQTYSQIEYLIIDGSSSDGTIGLLKKYKRAISFWISERDNGLYHAMNKALKKSNGDWIIFMNAGDVLNNKETIKNFAKILKDKNTTYFGRANILKAKSNYLYPSVKNESINNWLEKNIPNHQSMFFPRSFYCQNFYDLDYTYFSDADYKYRAKLLTTFCFVDEIVVDFQMGGISSKYLDIKTLVKQSMEIFEFSKKYVGYFFAIKKSFIFILKIFFCHISNSFKRERK
jgi:putative colanic acid biosynthesis glycosyltransferase